MMTTNADNHSPDREPSSRFGVVVFIIALVVLGGVGIFFALGDKSQDAQPRTTVVTTIPPLTWLAGQIVGDRRTVHGLLPAGASPHTYDLKPSDATAIEKGLVLLFVDPDLDGWAAKAPGTPKLAVLGQLLPSRLLEMEEHAHDDAGDGHEHHHHGHYDPHFWLDPTLMAYAARVIANELSQRDPAGREIYEANARRVEKELASLDAELAEQLKPFTGKAFVQFHPSFGYFFARYGLKSLGSVEAFPGTSPSPAYLANLRKRMIEQGAAGIFIEPQLSPQAAEALSEGASIKTIRVDPLGGIDGESYLELMRRNAKAIVEALRGQ